MLRRDLLAGAMFMAALASAASAAQAASMSPEYLTGRWTTGGRELCTKPEHEQTWFRKDGTFATEHNGKAVAVGFWQVEEDLLDMQILAAPVPHAVPGATPADYTLVHVGALTFDVADDQFRMVQDLNGVLQGLNMFRCPVPDSATGPTPTK